MSTCGLCEKNQSKYCCPRCEVLYCSLDCYKSEVHAECSEGFYRDCVNEELASHHTDDESKKKMINILKRFHNNELDGDEDIDQDSDNDSDDFEELDLNERIKDLDLDDPEAVWSALTQDERNEFEALLSIGDVGSIIPRWKPWWTFQSEEKLIESISESSKEEKHLQKCPKIKDMPKLNILTNVQPSPVIKYNIYNVIASYAFVVRYFNGEIESQEAAVYIINICANLDTNTNFEDAMIAVESVAQKCLQSELVQTDEISLNTMKSDFYLILQGPSKVNKHHYLKAALSHLHSIFLGAKSVSKSQSEGENLNKNEFSKKFPDHKKEHFPKLDKIKVQKCLRKLEYYLSYVNTEVID